jgi:hypothetical protein
MFNWPSGMRAPNISQNQESEKLETLPVTPGKAVSEIDDTSSVRRSKRMKSEENLSEIGSKKSIIDDNDDQSSIKESPVKRSSRKSRFPSIKEEKLSIKTDEETDRKWYWICPTCLILHGKMLLKKEIQVWWVDDNCSYTGKVNGYDEKSNCHRIQYYDGEWEFLSLAYEAFLVSGNSDVDGDDIVV